MGRKRLEKQDMHATAETKLKPVRVDLDQDVHSLFRQIAAKRGLSMAALARDVVSDFARSEAKKEGFRP